MKPNREDSGHQAVARCRVPAADRASVGRGLDCVRPVQHGRIGDPGKTVVATFPRHARSQDADESDNGLLSGTSALMTTAERVTLAGKWGCFYQRYVA